jgi:tetratricopeptide (TPR) repeat protein
MLKALLFSAALCAAASAAETAPDARLAAAIQLYRAGDYSRALQDLRSVSARGASAPFARIAACLAELHLGRGASAAKDFTAYAAAARRSSDPRSGTSMGELAIVSTPFVLFGEEPARPVLLKGLAGELAKSDPSGALGWELLGYYGLQSGEKASLDAAAARLKELAPRSALGPFFAGFSATLAGNRAEAEADLGEAVRRDPDFTAARAALTQARGAAADDGVEPLARAQARLFAALGVAAAIFTYFRARAALSRDLSRS